MFALPGHPCWKARLERVQSLQVPAGISPYTETEDGGNAIVRILSPPMSRQTVLRVMVLGFGLVVLLVMAAAYVGYQGSQQIQENAQDLVREHLLNTERATELETRIEEQSGRLLGGLIWILGACFVLAVGGSALTIWTTDKAFRRLEWQTAELTRVSWHMVESNEKIARRFSHEIHDELGQAMAGVKGMMKRMSPEELPQQREELLGMLDEVMTGIRELSQMLRPVILDDFGLDAGLRWLSERFAQRTRIQVKYDSSFSGRMSDNLETQLFRIAQEALTNIARHSGATEASMRLDVARGRVTMEIHDNGKGISDDGAPSQPSLGMVGMRARARQVEGELKVENRLGVGLRILVEAPFRGQEEDGSQENPDPAG
ncbi:MAG: ATP-binding protein [Acidobacteriota bacterium]